MKTPITSTLYGLCVFIPTSLLLYFFSAPFSDCLLIGGSTFRTAQDISDCQLERHYQFWYMFVGISVVSFFLGLLRYISKLNQPKQAKLHSFGDDTI